MGSLTKKLKTMRKNKVRSSGKDRKRALRHGTTPAFPVHAETEAEELPQPPRSKPVSE